MAWATNAATQPDVRAADDRSRGELPVTNFWTPENELRRGHSQQTGILEIKRRFARNEDTGVTPRSREDQLVQVHGAWG